MKRFLIFLLILSLFLRTLWVTRIPSELFGDEIDVGYQAYSLLKTGRDLYSQPFPLYPKSLSELRLPVLLYSTVPSVALLGLNSLSVRLPEVLFGSIAPLILFLLVLKVSGKRSLAVFSAIFLAILPWHIHYSRVAFEVVIMLDFIMLGSLLYLRRSWLLSALFFALTFYTYSTSIVFVPLLLIGLFVHAKKIPTFIFAICFLFLLYPFFYNLYTGSAGSRYLLLSIFKNPDVYKYSIELRNSSKQTLEPVFHNRYISIGEYFMKNYLSAFSTDFLFVRGDPTIRHSFMISGQLLPIFAPFVLIGLAALIIHKQFFWLYWLTISPIASALTYDGGFHATRLFFMVIPLSIATAAGYWHILQHRKYIWHVLTFVPIIANFVYLSHFYIIHYPKVSWRWWQTGYQQVFSNLPTGFSKYYINNTYEPSLIRFLFYTKYDPKLFQSQFTLDQPIKDISYNYDGFKLGDKYVFGTFSDKVNKYNLGSFLESDILYLVSARDEIPPGVDWTFDKPAGAEIISQVYSPENIPLFYLITKSE